MVAGCSFSGKEEACCLSSQVLTNATDKIRPAFYRMAATAGTKSDWELYQRKCIFSQFWRLQVQGQTVGRSCSEASSPGLHLYLVLSSRGLNATRSSYMCTLAFFFFNKDAGQIRQDWFRWLPFHVATSLKALSPNSNILKALKNRVNTSSQEFGGGRHSALILLHGRIPFS